MRSHSLPALAVFKPPRHSCGTPNTQQWISPVGESRREEAEMSGGRGQGTVSSDSPGTHRVLPRKHIEGTRGDFSCSAGFLLRRRSHAASKGAAAHRRHSQPRSPSSGSKAGCSAGSAREPKGFSHPVSCQAGAPSQQGSGEAVPEVPIQHLQSRQQQQRSP